MKEFKQIDNQRNGLSFELQKKGWVVRKYAHTHTHTHTYIYIPWVMSSLSSKTRDGGTDSIEASKESVLIRAYDQP